MTTTSSTSSTDSSTLASELASLLASQSSSTSTTSSSTTTTSSSTSSSTSQIDGLISGLDSSSIIEKLMSIAKLPQVNLQNKVTSENSKLTALQALSADFTALQTAASTLGSPDTWATRAATATSSAVTVSAESGASLGTQTFDVTRLATADTQISGGTVTGTSGTVMSGTTFSITNSSGTATTFTPRSGSLSDVVSAINAGSAGVTAAAVQVSAGVYRLQLTANSTGAASNFTVSGLDAAGGMNTLTSGGDAQLTVGSGSANAYTISSATNTFADALPGLTITANAVATGVAVTTTSDATAIAGKVQAMVDAANTTLTAIAGYTAYDSSTGSGGVLMGDSNVRNLQQQVLSIVGNYTGSTNLGDLGLSLTDAGTLSFDSAAFTTAYTANPSGVAADFQPAGTFTAHSGLTLSGSVEFHKSNDGTLPGSYDVKVTQAATQATATIDASAGLSTGQTITLGATNDRFTYTLTDDDVAGGLDALAGKLTSLAAQNGVAVTVGSDGGNLKVTGNGYGSVAPISLSATGGLTASAVTAGKNVAGTINGKPATGIGQLLSASATDPTLDGLVLKVTLTDADVTAAGGGSVGTLNYTAGLAGQYATLGDQTTDPIDGGLTTEIGNVNDGITDLKSQIDGMSYRLDLQQSMYETMYSNLETSLGQLKTQSQWLSSQIASLSS